MATSPRIRPRSEATRLTTARTIDELYREAVQRAIQELDSIAVKRSEKRDSDGSVPAYHRRSARVAG
jgi:hypothetical protein